MKLLKPLLPTLLYLELPPTAAYKPYCIPNETVTAPASCLAVLFCSGLTIKPATCQLAIFDHKCQHISSQYDELTPSNATEPVLVPFGSKTFDKEVAITSYTLTTNPETLAVQFVYDGSSYGGGGASGSCAGYESAEWACVFLRVEFGCFEGWGGRWYWDE